MSKKSFTDANPAMAFISTAKEQEDFALTQPTKEELEAKLSPEPLNKVSKGVPMKKNPEYLETKSKRVQMLMQPSLYNSIKEKAEQSGISVNEMMHEILKNHLEQN
jgi:predicted HicB family RNase H-like nuclease